MDATSHPEFAVPDWSFVPFDDVRRFARERCVRVGSLRAGMAP